MRYIISSNPTTPNYSLLRLDARARREGYRIARDHYASPSSLIDARLCGPPLGLDRVGLGEMENAIEVTNSTDLIRSRRRSPRLGAAPALPKCFRVVALNPPSASARRNTRADRDRARGRRDYGLFDWLPH